MDYIDVKSLIVNGKNHISDCATDAGIFRIRALTLGERAEIQSRAMAGIKTTGAKGPDGQTLKLDKDGAMMDLEAIQGVVSYLFFYQNFRF